MSTLLEQVLADYRVLDRLTPGDVPGVRCLTYEDFPVPDDCRLPAPPPGGWPALKTALAWWRACGPRDALMLNAVDRTAQWMCILNAWWPGRRRRLVLYDVFIDTPSPLKRRFVRWMVRGASLNVLFSRAQVDHYARIFDLPKDRFAFVPYQASHSKRPPVCVDEPWEFRTGKSPAQCAPFVGDSPANAPEVVHHFEPGTYVFAGGNSAREYKTLCAAAARTGIPVIITSTHPALFSGIDVPPNVRLISVNEPEFTRVMAGARFVVLPMTAGRSRGYGEQTILNSFWHGRPVIALDDVSASDYIAEGVDGVVLPPLDEDGLVRAMSDLWENPARTSEMGHAAHQKVREHYTHAHFIHRLVLLTLCTAQLR